MNEDKNPQVPNGQNDHLEDFDQRLQRARDLNAGLDQNSKATGADEGKGAAMRIGTELVVAIAVGGGIGFFIDSWLGTKPWFLIGFLFIGNAAGLWNVFRLTKGQSYKVGFDRDKQSEANKTK
ncbi:MAG: AtpZ/AtpI family protein [Rhodospirillaceae bacterium]|jgi:ATP synthase protein I|nr:AtpZ/AtpI family protein [Rhodospirillaceae bacterium]MBT4589478.1 AtpZ/AtpI family protein [Rhodospirillaceae bacterium]MBT4939158.1 AtpZ/AtpI family protein [Rhodospirillaceae bacterium]MBT7268252.1 AtpZ/AtpI family protein [Rhodospirillaceae bacterium]